MKYQKKETWVNPWRDKTAQALSVIPKSDQEPDIKPYIPKNRPYQSRPKRVIKPKTAPRPVHPKIIDEPPQPFKPIVPGTMEYRQASFDENEEIRRRNATRNFKKYGVHRNPKGSIVS